MIPKQLFFIWVGDKIPNWGKNAFLHFLVMNPDFNLNVIHIKNNYEDFGETGKDPLSFLIDNENPLQVETNESCIVDVPLVLMNTFNKVKSRTFLNWKYNVDVNKCGIKDKRVLLSDILRFELLYMYGGIYLDMDTFPLRPFDKKLLKKKQFFSTSYDPYHKGKRKFFFRDNFFMGSEPNRYIKWRYRDLPLCFLKGEMMYPCINKYSVKRVIFFDGNLHQQFYKDYPDEMNKGYVEHFFARSWK